MSFQRIHFLLCFLMLAICGSGFSLHAQTAFDIFISPEQWDAGTIPDVQIVEAQFSIENRLTYSVKLLDVETSCSCNAIFSLPPSLDPGEQKQFTAAINPSGKMGVYRWEVTIHTDSKDVPSVVLPISTIILRDTLLSEQVISFKPFFMGETVEKKLSIACRERPDFKLFSATCTSSEFTVTFEPSPVEGFYGVNHGYIVVISANPDVSPGAKKGAVILTTDLPGNETISLPLSAYVNGYLQASPAYLAFGLLSPGSSSRKTLRISHNCLTTPFHILNITASLPEIGTRVAPLIEDHFYEIEVTLSIPDDAPLGEFRGVLSIHTDFAGQPMMELPVQGIVFAPDKARKP